VVWNLPKWRTCKTSQLKNPIEDVYGFHFQCTWTCWKARNKLQNLTQRNTEKLQNREMQSMQMIVLPKTIWSSYPTESPSW
jgi:hypothetical protein